VRAELQTARELAERLLSLAQRVHSPTLLMWAHNMLGQVLYYVGEFALAHDHMEQGIALYDPQKHNPLVSGAVQDSGVTCLCFASFALWLLGYPDQALKRSQEALALAQELSHPYSLALALGYAGPIHQYRREGQAAQERAEAVMALCSEQGFPHFLAVGIIRRGWALTEQGQGEEGIAQMRQGMAALQTTGQELVRPHFLALLAEAYGKVGQAEEGLKVLAEALAYVGKSGERYYEAELHRLKGTLTLQSKVPSPTSKVEEEAEEWLRQAIDIARRQSAKSWELRAVMSLSQLWQKQGKKDEARQMLAEI
jgi:predicted ATPase